MHKLSEGIQLLLVEKRQEVVTESSHLAVTIWKQVLKNSGLGASKEVMFGIFKDVLDLLKPLNSLLLSLTFGISPFSHVLFVE